MFTALRRVYIGSISGEAFEVSRQTIESVQILRFIAALIVVLDHCTFVGKMIAARSNTPFHFPMFPGRLGVDIFFIISGFIMVYISSDGGRWTITPAAFFQNRWIRIAPIYLVATILYVALYFLAGNFERWSLLQYLTSALFIPYFDEVTKLPFPILGQGWTLCFEMFFYSIFAIALNLPRRASLVFLCVVFFSLVLVGLIWNFVSGSVFVLTPMPTRADFIVPRFWLHSIILEFLAGILLAMLREHIMARHQLWSFAFPISVCLAIIVAYILQANLTDDYLKPFPSLIRFSCALSVVAICVLTTSKNRSAWLQNMLVFLGGCSYSLYLFHPHVIFLMDSLWKRLGALADIKAFVVVGTLLSILVSVAVYLSLETRMIRLFNTMRPKIAKASQAYAAEASKTLSSHQLASPPEG
ncbi:acyltransferase family protein [Bradyrhizobium sp. CCBAU 11386]|uniref:acyltransferase family protein n=1 Tax=Bradyrhizobium sp. CCBAU 11386 TaxID=1630837 RepID=UPI002302E8B1|nr:acyltransferase [Bradyrhizobium sp. CCBAU 11386]